MTELSKKPVPDRAEYNAFFPSEFSLNAYVAPKTDFNGVQFSQAYTGGKYKVLMIAADERYLPMQNGTRFSTPGCTTAVLFTTTSARGSRCWRRRPSQPRKSRPLPPMRGLAGCR